MHRAGDDDDTEAVELHDGSIVQLTSIKGRKQKRPIGFAVPKGGVEVKCKLHPRYEGAGEPRDCAGCRRVKVARDERQAKEAK